MKKKLIFYKNIIFKNKNKYEVSNCSVYRNNLVLRYF